MRARCGPLTATAKHRQFDINFVSEIANESRLAYQAIGEPMTIGINSNLIKSCDNLAKMLPTVAPNTLHTPISLVRWAMVQDDKPNTPKEAMILPALKRKLKSDRKYGRLHIAR